LPVGLTIGLIVYNQVITVANLSDGAVLASNLVLGLVLLALAHAAGFTRQSLGLVWTRRLAATGVVLVGVTALVVAFLYRFGLIPADSRLRGLGGGPLVWRWARIVLGTAMVEEFAFRGLLLAAWRRTSPTAVAVLLTSLTFGAWHFLPEIHRLRATAHPAAGSALVCSPAENGH
jgi:membrane protease YdiL (CAAX protease family)